jgi:lipoate-protein ligase A
VTAALRVIDSGLREGRRQIALDQALIEAHKAGRIPDSIRFLRFLPTALIGRHQALSREIDLEYCRARGIGVARRITGGGAIYFDEGQLGWELIVRRSTLAGGSLGDITRRICEAAAAGLSRLGVDARYRPRNDIEVGGRKVSGTGGFFDGDTLFFQGTVLADMSTADMLGALRVPRAKLEKRALDSAAQRVTTLKELLGAAPPLDSVREALLAGFAEHLAIAPAAGEITDYEEALAARHHDEEIGTDEFVAEIDEPDAEGTALTASHTGAGGTIEVHVRLEGPRRDRIREVLITGDFFVSPPRTVYDLEASLRNVAAADAGAAIERFFSTAQVSLLTAAPADFRIAVEAALAGA